LRKSYGIPAEIFQRPLKSEREPLEEFLIFFLRFEAERKRVWNLTGQPHPPLLAPKNKELEGKKMRKTALWQMRSSSNNPGLPIFKDTS